MSKNKSKSRLTSLPQIDPEVLKRQLGHTLNPHMAKYIARPANPDKPLDNKKDRTFH